MRAGSSAAVCAALLIAGCASVPDAPSFRTDALTLHASFDARLDADVAAGDPVLYHAPSWAERSQLTPGLPPQVTHVAGGGRYGDGLRFAVGADPVFILFRAEENIAYRESDWSGTISFWMSLDPDEDLAPGFSDPLMISSKNWNDAALFVDFTRDDVPRHFRFAAFADLEVWNQSRREWDDVPAGERPMIDISGPPFRRDVWTHVAMTFENFNTGRDDGVLTAYLDGEEVGRLSGREQTFSWEPEEAVIAIGINYVGRFDDLQIFDRALTGSEIDELYQPPGSVQSLGN